MPKPRAIAIIFERNGRFLLGRRASHKRAAGYWCAISGRIENGESEREAVAREAQEELGVKALATEKVGEIDTHDGSMRIHWWRARIESGEPKLNNDEHSELRWVTLKEMKDLSPIFEDDIKIFESL